MLKDTQNFKQNLYTNSYLRRSYGLAVRRMSCFRHIQNLGDLANCDLLARIGSYSCKQAPKLKYGGLSDRDPEAQALFKTLEMGA